jgi:hypothetical protein
MEEDFLKRGFVERLARQKRALDLDTETADLRLCSTEPRQACSRLDRIRSVGL